MRIALKVTLLLAFGLLLTAQRADAQLGTLTGTTTVSVTVGPQAGLHIINSTTALEPGPHFHYYLGSTHLTYYVRTSASGGSGTITLKVTSDFSPSGGPSVASPPASGDALTYSCTVASPGTACTGRLKASTTSTTPLASFGSDAHTSSTGSLATVYWMLANDPEYKTGVYTSTITFTISAS